ncbi:TniQ family protein [Endozoicomonas ascidiicola]|uniref:TniQ family protein n=1 Tax=Endozoicomonas ascidiicola TaxID=1698521 RepID=UPI000831ACCD|nr:TniQ family protein [Endozoicomonas ascidiicola]
MFLIRPEPEYDESLESYIIRLAEENRFRVKKLFPHLAKLLQKQRGKLAGAMATDLSRFNLYHANTSSSKRYWALHQLSELCCKDRMPLLEMAVLKTSRRFGEKHTALFWKGLDIPRIFFRSESIPICPQCLKEKPYILVFWHISLVRACPKHQTLLIESCPQCGLAIDYIRHGELHTCPCGFELSTAVAKPANPKLVRLSEQVYGFKPESSDQDNLLFRKSTTEAVFGAVLWFKQWVEKESDSSPLVDDDFLLRCIEFFDDWPARLSSRLEKLAYEGLEYSERSMKETAFRSLFGALLKISRYLPDDRLASNEVLKTVFAFLDQIVFQEDHPYSEIAHTLLDSFEACVILGVSIKQLARLIEDGLLHPCKQLKDKEQVNPTTPLFRLKDVFVLWSVSFQSRHSNRNLYLSRW